MMNLTTFFPDHDHALSVLEAGFERLGDPKTVRFVCHYPIDDDLNIVNLVAVQLHLGYDVHDDIVHPDFGKSHLSDLLEKLPIMTLSAFDYRSQDVQLLIQKL